jgi:hypothetical protein
MSNPLAIAAVTETIVSLLESRLATAQVSGARVTAVTPDQPGNLPNPGINVFLYQATPNAAFRNADLPTRAADGSLLRKPQAAIDLHYLLTFYGDDTYYEPQRLLGAATLALHAEPKLPRSLIQPVQIGFASTAPSNLEAQAELIRLTPVVFTLEEMSKLWSFLFKVDYVLSAGYLASVVLIETDDATPPPALPALSFSVHALAPRQPIINQVVASPDPTAPITASGDIAVIGRNLAAPSGGSTQVLVNGVAQAAGSITPTRITLPLPANLQAGAQTVQVLQPVALGQPQVDHPGTGAASAIAAFILSPTIKPGSLAFLPAFGAPPGPAITATIVPKVRAGQSVLLRLLPSPAGVPARLFDGGALTADADTVTVPIPGLASGSYAASVLVDGAMSQITFGPGGAPTGPLVAV